MSKIDELLKLAKPYLERNDFGVAHTKRVLNLAEKHFSVPKELEELLKISIILHDIGGPTIKEQYEKGPEIARKLLRKLGYVDKVVEEVCQLIRTHHDRPDSPSSVFKILYDADQLAKFSEEEFPYYDSHGINWEDVINSMYHEHSKKLAREMLNERLGKRT